MQGLLSVAVFADVISSFWRFVIIDGALHFNKMEANSRYLKLYESVQSYFDRFTHVTLALLVTGPKFALLLSVYKHDIFAIFYGE